MSETLTKLPTLVPEPVELPGHLGELRAQVRTFLAEERASGAWTPGADVWLSGWDEEFSKRLGARGWLGMTIPTEYGGHGRTALDRYVVTEELLAAGAPVAAHWVADRQIGPSLMRFGTEEQRRRFLPGIARGEVYFGIGMSEPDSGSDLASVRTRAEKVDGGYSMTGTKVWTSGAHHAHAFFALVRTSPRDETNRHAGLSQLLVELDRPGITVRPIPLLTGAHHFNEVVFDHVFIPDEMVFGEIGSGWAQVTGELAFERSGPERFLSTFPLLSALVGELGRAAGDGSGRSPRGGASTGDGSGRSPRGGASTGDGSGRSPRGAAGAVTDAGTRRQVGALVSRLWTLRRMSLAVAGALESGEAPELAAALVKDLGTRYENEIVEASRLLVDIAPDPGAGPGFARLLADAVQHAPGFTLRGGTNEVLRGIVARGMGLR